MACTATATRDVYEEVVTALEMSGCVKVSMSPDRQNIFYSVKFRTEIEKDFSDLLSSLRMNQLKTSRVIIYCQSLNMCSDLFAHFLFELGSSSYYPPGAPQLSDNRLFGMYHASTPKYNKEVIQTSLSVPDGIVRVVFATVALGMGINFQNVNLIIHYGSPRSIEDYFQESGRGGRSGEDAESMIYWNRSDCPVRKEPTTAQHRELIDVRNYLENKTCCRRKWLLHYFDPECAKPGSDPMMCCAICAMEFGELPTEVP